MPKYDQSTFIVYLDLPVDVANLIDDIRREVNSPGVKRWVAHITFKQDADYKVPVEEIIGQIDDFCYALKPICLELTGLKLKVEADGISWNIYVGINEWDLLHRLTKSLSKLLTPLTVADTADGQQNLVWEQTDGYYPHISVIDGTNFENGRKLLDELKQKHNLAGQITCNSVTLAQWKETQWQKVKTIDLKETFSADNW